MRLNPQQVQAIVAAARSLAGSDANVRLFGSRVDDRALGGDIDLLVECSRPVERPVWLAAQITARVQRALGDRKIDVLLIDPSTPLDAVHRAAQATGVLLSA
jgi:predicted nucleotidyltransferase